MVLSKINTDAQYIENKHVDKDDEGNPSYIYKGIIADCKVDFVWEELNTHMLIKAYYL